MTPWGFIQLAEDLDTNGLVWQPEIGDEVSFRENLEKISILVDPDGMTPTELRATFLWLPTIEQLIDQIEARQGILFHAGLELTTESVAYKTVIKAPMGHIEAIGDSMRLALGGALRDLLSNQTSSCVH